MGGVLNGYVTNPNPTPILTPNPNRNPNSNQINEKIQKETTLEIDQITKCQFEMETSENHANQLSKRRYFCVMCVI
jgi:nitrate reductase cytochrome c-type subunit